MATTDPSFSIAASTASPVFVPKSDLTNTTELPTTIRQREIWLACQQSVEASCAFNEIASLQFTGNLNPTALQNALEMVVRRHDSLRATVSTDGTKMCVASVPVLSWEFVDWSDQDDDDLAVSQLKLLQAQSCIPFDLASGPLLRVVLQKTANNLHTLTIAAHAIVFDYYSLNIFCRDLGHLYDELTGELTNPLPKATSYRHYSDSMAEYIDSADAKNEETFWREQFKDHVPVLDLPIDQYRPTKQSFFSRRYDHVLSSELVGSLKQLGAQSECSLFATMLAAFESFLARISCNIDFCTGVKAAGQLTMGHPELIGQCSNILPLRSNINLQFSFGEQLNRTHSQLLTVFKHQRYPFEQILATVSPPRDPSRSPMLAVAFDFNSCIDTGKIGFETLDVGVQVEPRMYDNYEWSVNGIINDDDSVMLQVQYNTDLFSSYAMKTLFEGFEGYLFELTRNVTANIAEIPVMSIRQVQEVLVEWNQTHRDYPLANSLHAEIGRQAKQAPEQIAVCFENRTLTYAQLDEKSNQLANYLVTQGISTGDLVGICVPRDENMLVALLGILKTGAGYVPLDPAFPKERLQYMCDHSELKLVIGTDEVSELLHGFGKPFLVLEEIANETARQSNQLPNVQTNSQQTCYVIYTSGSTGTPKGVNVPHGAVVNFLYSMAEKPGFSDADSILAVTTLSFDIAVLELYLPLITGGSTVIASKAVTSDGTRIVEAIKRHNITLFQSTPATLRLMIAAGWGGKSDLKVLCGGEPMPDDLVAPLLDRCSQLWNMYGPTETTVWSSVFQVTDANEPILIGKPIANTQIYLLDKNFQPVPVGSDGEIFIGGAGVTLDYLHQVEMTKERFVENPYSDPSHKYCNHRLYRTGDLGRFRRDGNIQFLRRNDKQVKVRGFRIELGEIESALKSIVGVEQAVAVVREDKPGDTRLVAYWTHDQNAAAGSTEITSHSLRDSLRDVVPYYMVPQYFVKLEKIPQTENKKIDYKALPAPHSVVEPDSEELQPTTVAQVFIARIWREVLEVEDVFLNDNFFDLGGHSLLVMKVITTIADKTGARLSPPDFLTGTLEQLADFVAEEAENLSGVEADSQPIHPNPGVDTKDHVNAVTRTEDNPNNRSFPDITRFWD